MKLSMVKIIEIGFCYIMVLAVAGLDQFIKYHAVKRLKDGGNTSTAGGFVKFILIMNRGAAFGIFRRRQRLLKVFISILVSFLFIYLSMTVYRGSIVLSVISLIFLLGGAVGNLIDRFRLGYVVDYVTFNIKRFPVFNAADLFIFTGAILMVIQSNSIL